MDGYWEMVNPEAVILEEIARGFSQQSVAMTYAFIMRQQGNAADYARINAAIKARWKGKAALERVKTMAWRFFEGRPGVGGTRTDQKPEAL